MPPFHGAAILLGLLRGGPHNKIAQNRLHCFATVILNLVGFLVNKLKMLVGELGLVGAVCYVVYRLGAASGGIVSLYRYLLVAQPIPARALLAPHRGRSIMVQQVDIWDPALLSLPLDRKVIEYRASQGAICFGAFKDGRIIGCLWLCLAGYREDEVRCRYLPMPPDTSAWDFDVYLEPEHRSGLGFARLWDEANGYLRGRGISFSWSRISAFNPRSLAAHARLGATIAGTATFLRFGPCQLMMASVPPYRHFSLRQEDYPVIHLSQPEGRR
jgi:hypothetical protein